jgi:hypothetical protein
VDRLSRLSSQDEKEISDYKELLAQNLIRPTSLEIWIMKANGSGKRQITNLGAASFGPVVTADGKRIIFSSNYDPVTHSTGGMGNFELWLINSDGSGLERVTYSDGFRRLPHVLARWKEAGVGLEPQRQSAARDQYFHRGLGAVGNCLLMIVDFKAGFVLLRGLRGFSWRTLRLKAFPRRAKWSVGSSTDHPLQADYFMSDFAMADLPFSSTRIRSIPLSPVFSGKCVPAGANCASPALTVRLSFFPPGTVNSMEASVRNMATESGWLCIIDFSCAP